MFVAFRIGSYNGRKRALKSKALQDTTKIEQKRNFKDGWVMHIQVKAPKKSS